MPGYAIRCEFSGQVLPKAKMIVADSDEEAVRVAEAFAAAMPPPTGLAGSCRFLIAAEDGRHVKTLDLAPYERAKKDSLP